MHHTKNLTGLCIAAKDAKVYMAQTLHRDPGVLAIDVSKQAHRKMALNIQAVYQHQRHSCLEAFGHDTQVYKNTQRLTCSSSNQLQPGQCNGL